MEENITTNYKKTEKSDGVAGGVAWKFAERLLAQGVTLVVSIILARVLVPEDYGIISIVLIFIAFADVFVTSGFSTSLIQKKDADETDFSTIFYCSLIVSIIIYAILFFTAPVIARFYDNEILTPVIRVFSLRLPISAYNSVQHAYVSRNMLFKKFFFSTLGGTIVSAAVGISFAYLGYGVWAIVAQYLSNTIIDTIVLTFTIKWHPQLLFSKKSAKTLMGYGWKVLAADFSGTFFNQLRTLLIGKFYTPAELAYYDRGRNFSSLATDNLSTALMSVLFPALSNKSDNKVDVKELLRKAVRMMSYIVFPVTIGIALVARPMVSVLLTEKWLDCVPYIQILCVASAITLVGDMSLQAIKAIGRSDTLLLLEFIKKPVFVGLLILGLYFGVIYVALTMLVYSVFAMIVNLFPLKKYLGYSFFEVVKDLAVAMGLTLLMSACVIPFLFVPIPEYAILIIQVVIGILIYVGMSLLFKVKQFQDIKNMISSKSKTIKNGFGKIHEKISYRIHVILMYIFRIFPINKKKILFCNFIGKGYSAAPSYICNELLNGKEKYKIVWLSDCKDSSFPDEVKIVKLNSIRAIFELCTSYIWIDNCRKFAWVRKRRKQKYIQTWHGDVCIKMIEKDAISSLPSQYIVSAKNDSKMADYVVSGCEWRTRNILSSFWYSGDIIKAELYKIEKLSESQLMQLSTKIREEMSIDKKLNIAIYAPTFRKDSGVSCYNLDYEMLISVLERRFGGEWCVIVRLHPNISYMSEELSYSDKIINGTNYPDIRDLLQISQVLITDYSGCMFDAFRIDKYVFLYATDIQEYLADDRGLYFDLNSLPAPLAQNNEELAENILKFDDKKYIGDVEKLLSEFGYYNNNGVQIINDIIKNILKGEHTKS